MDRHMTTEKMYVIIEGTIGAGKTTLCRALSKRADIFGSSVEVQLEPAEGENPYLDDYYSNPDRWAFEMQVALLSKRFRAHKAAQSWAQAGVCSVIADRSYFGDRCFAEVQVEEGHMDRRSYDAYMSLHKDMQAELLYPSCFVWLKTDVDTALKRVSRRMSEIAGRQCECAISRKYMDRLGYQIDRMMRSLMHLVPVVEIDPVDADGNEKGLDSLCDEICEGIRKVRAQDAYDCWQGVR